ncbi:DUF1692-domain-containing protein [Aulographum hederae CBS 113979]|uniref:Endoplasmic reticulum-Golgi intermediate compartment protein n=1 Tax=Aulographum hederae CBS 113979 TaxID=1176131 RepID=A0A6G1H110_9PEZI|nr:DUF1692-domain-containing protein [Aulographum hederae CBS 113979]
MNGFSDQRLSEADFGESKGISVKSFDAFPKTKPTYLARSSTRSGSTWTALILLTAFTLVVSETRRWWAGTTTQSFSVEKGVAHQLQLNLDVVVAMHCNDLHINVQDASGDRILAGEMLKKDPTNWAQWDTKGATHKLESGSKDEKWGKGEEEDVHDYLGLARKKKKFPKTPRVKGEADSCRIYGSMEGNKVQGDFHITARGHGYMEFGEHLTHDKFNFTHTINELSFGPFYPSLQNPLDNTLASTRFHFYKFQYYLSIVPTIYTTDARILHHTFAQDTHHTDGNGNYHKEPDWNALLKAASQTVQTNQYAVTEQSHSVPENFVPGIFFKYDFEPILLLVMEEWSGFLKLLVRLINVVSGVMVAGGWCYQITDLAVDFWAARKGRGKRGSMGVLHGRSASMEEKGNWKGGYED